MDGWDGSSWREGRQPLTGKLISWTFWPGYSGGHNVASVAVKTGVGLPLGIPALCGCTEVHCLEEARLIALGKAEKRELAGRAGVCFAFFLA